MTARIEDLHAVACAVLWAYRAPVATRAMSPGGDLSVVPGSEVHHDVTIRNRSDVVDEYVLTVLGDAADWATIDPPSVSLFPGSEGTARVTFAPPREPWMHAGAIRYGVRVEPKEDAEGPYVEEGTLVIEPFREIVAELAPRTAAARLSAKYEIAAENRGNAPADLLFGADEADARTRVNVDPGSVVLDPENVALAKVRVRPKRPIWWGQPEARPFNVVVETGGEAPQLIAGTVLLQPVIPRRTPQVLAVLAALLLAWFLFLRPQVDSIAKDAVGPQLKDQQTELETQRDAIDDIRESMGESPLPTTDPIADRPFDQRLSASAGADGEGDDEARVVPDGSVLSLTDVFLQNPLGRSGFLRVKKGTRDLLVVNLENYRDLDYHFVSPVVVREGESLRLVVQCGDAPCSAAAYLVGILEAA